MAVGVSRRQGRDAAGALDICGECDEGVREPGLPIRWDTLRTLHAASPPGGTKAAPPVALQNASQECA